MNQEKLSQSFNPAKQLNLSSFTALNSTQHPPIKIQQFQGNHEQANDFYNQQISKLLYANTVINAQLSSAFEEKKILLDLIASAEQREAAEQKEEKEKRFRRCAKEIQRKHTCPSKDCKKSYGSEGSLAQHIRLKHPNSNCHEPPLIDDPC